jgi:acetyl esterase/lipase
MNFSRLFRALFVFFGLAVLLPVAQGETLRERLRERLVARQQAPGNDGGPPSLRDQHYGERPDQTLDIYLPAANGQAAPVILMVHGGAWKIGDKGRDKVVEHKLARWRPRGFAFISVNYPMLPQADPLAQADNVAKALAYVQAQSGRWNLDPERVVLMGHSAGAHLISLLDADPARAFAQGARPWLGAVALDSAAMDVSRIMAGPHYGFYDEAFGQDKDYWRRASPTAVLTSRAPPLLMVCSTRRADACPQARGFADRAAALGVHTRVLPEDLHHAEINDQLGLPGAYTEAVESFIAGLDGRLGQLLRAP